MRRPKLTYANVVATLALVLAVGGGTVYAAVQLGKNDVHSRNIAKGAVKKSDLAKNSVTSPKIKNGSVEAVDLGSGVIKADVTGSATGGPQGGINANTVSPLPISGTTSFTPKAGQVSAVVAEAQFTIAAATNTCSPAAFISLNGQPIRIFANGDTSSPTLITTTGYDADGPFGLLNPGTPLAITAQLQGDSDCTANSQLDRVEVRIVQVD